jgi:hypothetical protein
MIEKITLDELIEEVFQDQLYLLKDSELSPKERNEKKEKLKESILECDSIENLCVSLKKLGCSADEVNEYLMSFFVES